MREQSHDARLIAVLKANAYGLGMAEIARVVHPYVDGYAVAYLEEGVSLRAVYRHTPILLLVYAVEDVSVAVEYNLTLSISSLDDLMEVTRIVEESNSTIDIELVLNTGMNRYGFNDLSTFSEAIAYITHHNAVRLRGVYSHLFDDDRIHNIGQMDVFDDFLTHSNSISDIDIKRHICASTGVLGGINRYDTVRLGIGMYVGGHYGTRDVLSLYSHVQSIRYIKKGEYVGYSCNYRAKCDIMIAIVIGGYADGLDRRLRGIDVYIHDMPATIIGNICMDVFFIDITGIDGVNVGDEVTIIGGVNTVERVSSHVGITPHELLTAIRGRVKRSYI